MADETVKVDTGEEPDSSIKVEQEVDTPEEEEDDGVVLDTSTGKGLENIEIPDSMREPVVEGGMDTDAEYGLTIEPE